MPDYNAIRSQLQERLAAMDEPSLSRYMFGLGLTPDLDLERVQKIAGHALAGSPHEVQQYWLGECNCDGHLN